MKDKVYVLTIRQITHDGFTFKLRVLIFYSWDTCLKWVQEEIDRKKEEGYTLMPTDDVPNRWKFVSPGRWGSVSIVMDGIYKEVMK